MPFHTFIKIIDDTIQSTGTPYDQLTPREQHTRNAMFLITVLAPIAGAFLAANFAPRSARASPHLCPDAAQELKKSLDLTDEERIKELQGFELHSAQSFRYNKLVAFWFLTIGLFGALVYVQSGRTTRGTFVLAVMHNQVEVLLNCLLLGLPYTSSVSAAIVYGFAMYPVVLFAPSMALVFIGAAVVGGANDFLIVCLLTYGKQWLLAAGALAHVFSAVSVFTCTIDNFGVLPYNLCIFLGIWTHISLTVSGILYAKELHRKNKARDDDISPSLSDTHTPNKQKHLYPVPHIAHTKENGYHGGSNGTHAAPLLHTRSSSHTVEKKNGVRSRSPSPLLKNSNEQHRRGECYARNPMRHVRVPASSLIAMIVVSLIGSTLITIVLAYWVPLWGEKHAPPPSTLYWVWNMFSDSTSPGRY